jgi:hypothetical protein
MTDNTSSGKPLPVSVTVTATAVDYDAIDTFTTPPVGENLTALSSMFSTIRRVAHESPVKGWDVWPISVTSAMSRLAA